MPDAAPLEPIQAPVEPIKAPVEPTEASSESSKTQKDGAHLQNASDDNGILIQWPSQHHGLHLPLFPNFWILIFGESCLNYQQSLVILHDWAIPEVNALQAPKLDQQLLNQVPSKVKSSSKKGTKKYLLSNVHF